MTILGLPNDEVRGDWRKLQIMKLRHR